jgi:hypothetical protein
MHRIKVASLEPIFMMGLIAPLVGLPISGAQQLRQRYGWYTWLIMGPLLLPSLLLGAVFVLVWSSLKLAVYLGSLWKKLSIMRVKELGLAQHGAGNDLSMTQDKSGPPNKALHLTAAACNVFSVQRLTRRRGR